MKHYWVLACEKVDGMSLREHGIIFFASAFVVIALFNKALFDPLWAKENMISSRMMEQQNKIKEFRTQIQNMAQAKRDDEHSPLHIRLTQLKQQLQEQDGYLQSLGARLVEPDKMAVLLEQVLKQNNKLQLVALKTLPVSFLIDKPEVEQTAGKPVANSGSGLIFKHGVQITVRGGYADLLQYLAALEKMEMQMFWGEVSLSVEQHPQAVLTLTLYTLSLDKTWLTV